MSGTARDPNRIALEMACSTAGFAPTIAFETADYAVTATLVAKGFGIALIPELAWPLTSEPAMACIDVQAAGEPIARQISLAHRTSEHSQLVHELFNNLRANTADRSLRRANP